MDEAKGSKGRCGASHDHGPFSNPSVVHEPAEAYLSQRKTDDAVNALR